MLGTPNDLYQLYNSIIIFIAQNKFTPIKKMNTLVLSLINNNNNNF